MRLTSVKDGASLHNLTSADGDFTTTAVLQVDKVWFRLGLNFASLLAPLGTFRVVLWQEFWALRSGDYSSIISQCVSYALPISQRVIDTFSRCLLEFQAEQEFTFVEIAEKPVPSLLRNFSAPVRLVSDVTNDDLFFLLAHDSDQFNR